MFEIYSRYIKNSCQSGYTNTYASSLNGRREQIRIAKMATA